MLTTSFVRELVRGLQVGGRAAASSVERGKKNICELHAKASVRCMHRESMCAAFFHLMNVLSSGFPGKISLVKKWSPSERVQHISFSEGKKGLSKILEKRIHILDSITVGLPSCNRR